MQDKSNPQAILITVLGVVLIWPGAVAAVEEQPLSAGGSSGGYFKIQVVDGATGRGVPLVELRTTNNIRYYTDSNGIVAFYEPGLMGREVFFFVESHGYEFPRDGFGYRGTRLKTIRGGSAVLKIDRFNIAERLYRITGQGIYSDSILSGHSAPLENPVLNGQVMGQDSVYTCIYRGRLFWLWGDTNRASYPLGHFATAGAFSDLPGKGGLDPAVGVALEYFVDETGFSRPLCRLKEKGLVWLDGLLTVRDNQGRQRMVAEHARMRDLGHAYERGLVVFNDATESFEPVVRSGPDFLPYHNCGHALTVDIEGERYHYFATQFPLSVRMRVKAEWNHIIDPNCYEILTALSRPSSSRWVRASELIGAEFPSMPSLIEALEKEKEDTHLCDITSSRKVTPYGGSVYYNAYRAKWIAIFVEAGGQSSYLGELWYAEADTPVGPWAYARKIVTHDKYTFYNPMHHPYFDKDGGRIIFFEGTYSNSFSGSEENPTPRYDYNQIMYRLNLDDPRLTLPAAVYHVSDENGRKDYLLADAVERAEKWDLVESIPFCAVEPGRAGDSLVPIYAQRIAGGTKLILERPDQSARPLFHALPPSDSANDNSCVVSLYEYHHAQTQQRLYSTDPQLPQQGWVRSENPLCRLWQAPPGPLLLDPKAKPTPGR
ncbi:MAG: hypothetical protein JSW66_08455 [Phycisphaerales bacterium]|nr:MAG: hypothetical protein JSW66_08455 [Phycisphaerales bacterium]